MSSLIVPVTTIEALQPHPNADRLELAQVLGWQLVVPKGQYQVGQKLVYFPIGHYLDWPRFLETCAQYGVETVPVLANIAFELKEIKRFSEGRTQLMQEDAHIREGVVVRPERERHDPRIGRVILKYVSDSYLFGEKSDFTDV